MIKAIVIAIFITALPVLAAAQSATNFDYTGSTEILHYSPYEPSTNIWSPYFGTGGFIGGPSEDIMDGVAREFQLFQTTSISSLNISAQVLDPNGTQDNPYGSTTIAFGLDSVSPGIGYIPVTTQSITFQGYDDTQNTSVPFDVTLQPGKYWLVGEGNGVPAVGTVQDYIDPPVINTAVAPEPATWLLLLLGLSLTLIWGKFRLTFPQNGV